MTPYYSDDLVTIYHGDCRELLPDLAADALVTDPPYGVRLRGTDDRAYRSGRSTTIRKRRGVLYADDPSLVRELIVEAIPLALSRVDRGLVFPGPAMLFAYPEPDGIGGVFTPNGSGRSSWGFQLLHPILYYGKDPYLVDGMGSRPNGFRDEQPNKEKIDHPCPKPISWMRWAVVRVSREGETILDPFVGSGTTLVAAKWANRRAVGIEIEERYCEIAARRCSQEVLGLPTPADLRGLARGMTGGLGAEEWVRRIRDEEGAA